MSTESIEQHIRDIEKSIPDLSPAKLKALETRMATEHMLAFFSKDEPRMEICQRILRKIESEFASRT